MKAYRLSLIGGVIAAALIAGCDSSPQPVPISGNVKLDGEPVIGHIVFIPENPKLPKRGGPIEDGHYDVEANIGPFPGPHRVEIYSRKRTGRVIPHPDPEQVAVETVEVIPIKYNKESTLAVEIKPGPNLHDFSLNSN
jgi:hypothetical protein